MAHLGRFFTAIGFVLVPTSFSLAAIQTVDLNGNADHTDIQTAIDAGTSAGSPATDIVGRLRPCGVGVDIGAYEFGDCWPTPPFISSAATPTSIQRPTSPTRP